MLACVNDSAIALEKSLPSDIPPEREAAFEEIGGLIGGAAVIMLKVGLALEKARATYTNDKAFLRDVEEAFGWESSSVAHRLQVAERFRDRPEALQALGTRLPASALFKICSPKIDPEVFDWVLETAAEQRLTVKQVNLVVQYGTWRSTVATLEGGPISKVLEDEHRKLPAIRPLPITIELLALFAGKGEVRPHGEEGLWVEREGQEYIFPDRATADQAWRLEWIRKPDYVRFPLRLGDSVRFAEIDVPEVDGRPAFAAAEFVVVCGLKNWRIQVEYGGERYWAYRAGIVEHLAPIVKEVTNYPTRDEIAEFPQSTPTPGPDQPIAIAFTRPGWLHINSVMWRASPITGDRQLGTVGKIGDEIGIIDWPDGPCRYTWEEFAQANIHNCTDAVDRVREAFEDVGHTLMFDVLNHVFAQIAEAEDYCNA